MPNFFLVFSGIFLLLYKIVLISFLILFDTLSSCSSLMNRLNFLIAYSGRSSINSSGRDFTKVKSSELHKKLL